MLNAMLEMEEPVESTAGKVSDFGNPAQPVDSTPIALPPPPCYPVDSTECRDSEGNILSFCGMPQCVSRREWLRAQKELQTLREWKTMMEAKLEKAKYSKKISARNARMEKAMKAPK